MRRYLFWALFAIAPFSVIAKAAAVCSAGNFQCANGACVSVDSKCDGKPDCSDASDETHALCYNHYCHPSQFRCAYGGCVDGSAPCGAHAQCLDNSDLRLLRCRNKTAIVDGQFNCESGQKIQLYQLCDGEKNCADGSDESVRACAGRRCGMGQFQCKYGACVASSAMCDVDGHRDCADGSDEDAVLCNRPQTVVPDGEPKCKPPRWPDHSQNVIVMGPPSPNGSLSPSPTSVTFFVKCTSPYRLVGPEETHCERGQWSAPIPECKYFCEVPRDPSVTYYCGDDFDQKCDDVVQSGYKAQPKCNDHYHSPKKLQSVKCSDNGWMFLQTCEPDQETTTVNASTEPSAPKPHDAAKKCVLPPYPEYGSYSVAGWPNVIPGMTFDSVTVNITCDAPMRPVGPAEMNCSNGQWSVDRFTYCWYLCKVPRHPSVTYYCGDRFDEPCGDFVINRAFIRPKCNEYYRTTGIMMDLQCLQGNFPYEETCDLDVSISSRGNNLTLHLGGNLVVHVSGSLNSVAVDLKSENVIDWKIPAPHDTVYDDVY